MGNLIIKLFIKNYEETDDLKVREKYGKLSGTVGIISNLILCVMKIVIGIVSKSIAIVADGINNLADTSSSIITLLGFKLASRPEDEDHPYGHARYEYLTGLLISILIIIVGVQLLKSSIDKILHPDIMNFNAVTIAVLVIAILIKLWQAGFYINVGRRITSTTIIATATDSRNDVIATSAVLISVIISKLTGYNIDGYMGCIVALFIIWSGIQLVRETSSPLLGEAPDDDLVKDITRIVIAMPSVLGIHDLIVHNYGPGKVFASIHIEVDADGDLMESHDMIDNIERQVSESLNIHFVAHMDPIKTNDPTITHLKTVVSHVLKPVDGVVNIHDFRIIPGPTHTNVIFDVVLLPDCSLHEKEITDLVSAELKKEGNYFPVITFDKAYTRLSKR